MTFLRTARNLAVAAPLLLPLSVASAKEPVSASPQKQIVVYPDRAKTKRPRPRSSPAYDGVGTASWYGPRFHGRRTASGEIYNMRAFTAAHRTLPMSTQLRVTNLANGRSVILRVNDRGPHARGRIIDVSQAAARALGFERRGVAQVRVTVLGGLEQAESDR